MALAILITDPVTLLISSLGIFLSIVYVLYQAFRHYDTDNEIRLEQESITEWLEGDENAERLKVLLADYNVATEEVGRRDNVTLLVGTILITSSFIILGNVSLKPTSQASPPTSVFSMASILLFLIWLFVLHETGKVTNKITYDHLKAIERALTRHFQGRREDPAYQFGTHLLVCGKTGDQSAGWLRLRRMFWAFVLLLLSVAWMLLSISIMTL